MNFGKNTMKSGQSGNAMIYVLLALGLIGLLTATIMRQDSSDSGDLTQEQIEFQATQILSYASAAQNTLDQMIMTGTNPDNIDFAIPSATSFNTAPYLNKFFHPQGGGLNYKAVGSDDPMFDYSSGATNPVPGFYVTKPSNFEWSPSSAHEIVFTAYLIQEKVCEALNKKITGSAAIPSISSGTIKSRLVHGPTVGFAYASVNFLESDCPACAGYPSLCVTNVGGTNPVFYSILLSR